MTLPTKQHHIVHIIDHMGLGGAQRVVADLAIRQMHSGRSVSIICLRGPTPLSTELANQGIRLYYISCHRWSLRQFDLIANLLRNLAPSLVHLHLLRAQTIGRAAAVVAGVHSLVVHDHDSSAEIYSHPGPILVFRRLIEPYVPPCRIVYIVLTEEAREYAINIRRLQCEKLVVIPNGVDIDYIDQCKLHKTEARRTLNIAQNYPLIVTAGRLNITKGFDVLIEAMTILPPHIHLAIAGDGPERANLLAQIVASGLQSRIRLLGQLDDIRPLLRASDLYVQPSRREPFGLAAAEAAALGLPVVASAVGGLRHVVRHELTGLLVPPDHPRLLADAILTLTNDTTRANVMGATGRQYIQETFDISLIADQIDQVYASLL
ncbi:MAG: glycosyltransferase [Oscillochloridaceae bacterium umkhey_bin13]